MRRDFHIITLIHDGSALPRQQHPSRVVISNKVYPERTERNESAAADHQSLHKLTCHGAKCSSRWAMKKVWLCCPHTHTERGRIDTVVFGASGVKSHWLRLVLRFTSLWFLAVCVRADVPANEVMFSPVFTCFSLDTPQKTQQGLEPTPGGLFDNWAYQVETGWCAEGILSGSR